MITRITLALTDDERRLITRRMTGKNTPATRAMVVEYVHALIAAVIDPAVADSSTIVVEHTDDGRHATTFDPSRLTCTTLDHLYPLGEKTAETTCYCGARHWFPRERQPIGPEFGLSKRDID